MKGAPAFVEAVLFAVAVLAVVIGLLPIWLPALDQSMAWIDAPRVVGR